MKLLVIPFCIDDPNGEQVIFGEFHLWANP